MANGAIVGAGGASGAAAGGAGDAGAGIVASGDAGISPEGGVSGIGIAGGAGVSGGVVWATAALLSRRAAVKANDFMAQLLGQPRRKAQVKGKRCASETGSQVTASGDRSIAYSRPSASSA